MFRTARFVLIAVALSLVVGGCTTAPPASPATPTAPAAPAPSATATKPPAPVAGGSLTRAMTAEPVAIDPQGTANSGLNLVLPYLFDTLVTRQRDGKYAGLLAESWQVKDEGKVVDVTLKKGITFHDGTPLGADDVVFTFQRFKSSGERSPIFGSIKQITSVEAVDAETVRFSFENPTATFWSTIASPYTGILSRAAVEKAGEEMARRPVGTGPFRLEDWRSGVQITLARNPDYRWGPSEVDNKGPVYLDRLVFKVIPDAGTQQNALLSGEVDVIFVNEPAQMARFEREAGLVVQQVDLDSLIYLGYNCAKPPFDEVKVRQALSHAVNKKEIVETALAGLGNEAHTPLTPDLLGYNPELKVHGQGYDPDRTRALLEEAGFAKTADGGWERDGQRLSGRLLTSTRAPNEAVATVLQSQFKALGIPIEIHQADSAAVMKTTTEGAFDLLLWRYEWTDPDALNMFLSTARIRQTNRVFYSNPEADALFEEGLREFDPEKRALIYEEAQKIILADSPWQPLYTPIEALVHRKEISGIKIGTLGRMLVNDVTVAPR